MDPAQVFCAVVNPRLTDGSLQEEQASIPRPWLKGSTQKTQVEAFPEAELTLSQGEKIGALANLLAGLFFDFSSGRHGTRYRRSLGQEGVARPLP